MGYFSFKTQDTNRSIANVDSIRPTFNVYMHDNKGNVYLEKAYRGYGMFGGVCYYGLVAEMNGVVQDGDTDMTEAGMDIVFSGKKYIAPNLTESPDWTYTKKAPQRCDDQGYFYEN
jgi:hypothetical protein